LFALADSGVLRKEDFSDYYASVLFDAQVLARKEQSREEKAEADKGNGEQGAEVDRGLMPPMMETDYSPVNTRTGSRTRLFDYATILMPFYDRPAVQKIFAQIFQGKDVAAKVGTVALLLKNGRAVPDSILLSIAADDKYRAKLYDRLEKMSKKDLFPARYRTQEAMARSLLVESKPNEKPDSIVAMGKKAVTLKYTRGFVYFFKYKLPNQADWMMGISGLQPADQRTVNSDRGLVAMTGKKFTSDKPEQQQLEEKLHQLVLSKRKSARFFFSDRDNLFANVRIR
jgi:hypothetical protein